MLFNSTEFLLFLPITFALYWLLNKRLQLQNALVLVASYLFYGWWDWRFLSLIIISTLLDFWVGQKLYASTAPKIKRRWMWLSVSFNLGLLGFFKYYNFFIDSWVSAFSQMGYEMDAWTLSIVLPVGISFYTFQTMSYTLDIYKNKLEPTRDLLAFASFVSFFPQLVAGPIERASNLLPQMLNKRVFSYKQAVDGARLILWGLFKKVVIADSLAPIVNEIFSNYESHSSSVLILGAVLFAFQIYGDFSGYSDIARGVAKFLGFELMVNFKMPYFSRSIGEFWRRWHISLSTWFRDYVYIPLGGSRLGKAKGIRNVFVIFIVSGFWHGANWTFIVWGLIHALFFIPSFLGNTNRNHVDDLILEGNWLPSFKSIFQVLFTFGLVNLAWVFFRAESMSDAVNYISSIADFSNVSNSEIVIGKKNPAYILLLLGVEYFIMRGVPKILVSFRWLFYLICGVLIFNSFFENQGAQFIYFQF